jgi:hypothetical protein
MDKERRTFLKIILIGGGTLLAGKVLGPLFSGRVNDSFTKIDSSAKLNPPEENNHRSFRVVENERVLSIYDNSGEEIFQIDKGA